MVKPIGTLALVEADTTSEQGAIKATHDRGGAKRDGISRKAVREMDTWMFCTSIGGAVRGTSGFAQQPSSIVHAYVFCVLASEGLVFDRDINSSPPTRSRHKESRGEGRKRRLGFHREYSSCWRLGSEAWIFIGNVLRSGGLLSADQRSVTARLLRESDWWEFCLRCG